MDNRSLQSAFRRIREEVGDAKTGLGRDVFHFISSLTPVINVDLLIKNSRQETLLTWRADEKFAYIEVVLAGREINSQGTLT